MTIDDRLKIISLTKKRKVNWAYPKFAPLPELKDIFNELYQTDPNHVAYNFRINKIQKGNSSLLLEKEVIDWVKSMYLAKDFDGQVTSGGTENNITSLWFCRELFKQIDSTSEVLVINTSLTHYSMIKACNILCLDHCEIPLTDNFEMDANALHQIIETNPEKKFAITLTLGYTMTGTSDNIRSVCDLANCYNKNGKRIYLHIDAAINGVCHPFLASNPINLSEIDVDAISIDFHKTGCVPYNSSVLLWKGNLNALIATQVPYVPDLLDTSLLSSRSGISAIFCWATINALGIKGYTEMFENCMHMREVFLEGIKSNNQISVYSCPDDSPSIFIFLNSPAPSLIQLLNDFDLTPFSITGLSNYCYRIYFNNNLELDDLSCFLRKLSSMGNKC